MELNQLISAVGGDGRVERPIPSQQPWMWHQEALQADSDAVGLRRVDGPPCLLEYGLLPAPPRQVVPVEPQFSSDPAFRSCSFSLVTDKVGRGWALPGVNQSVYRAELLAVTLALERLRGSSRVVSDCKGVVKVVTEKDPSSKPQQAEPPVFGPEAPKERGEHLRVVVGTDPPHIRCLQCGFWAVHANGLLGKQGVSEPPRAWCGTGCTYSK